MVTVRDFNPPIIKYTDGTISENNYQRTPSRFSNDHALVHISICGNSILDLFLRVLGLSTQPQPCTCLVMKIVLFRFTDCVTNSLPLNACQNNTK